MFLALKDMQQVEEYTPFPSATRGSLFFNHVMFAAGLASCATHFPSCGTQTIPIWEKLAKNLQATHIERNNHHHFKTLYKWKKKSEQICLFNALLPFEDWGVFYATDHEMPKAFPKPLRSVGYFNCSGGILLFTNSWESLQRTLVTWSLPCLKIPWLKWGISHDNSLLKIMYV